MAVATAATLTVLAKLEDQVSGKAGAMRKGLLAAGAAISGAGILAGKAWADATDTIARGTGATGKKLDELLGSFQDLAGTIPRVGNAQVATAIADLNTHLGLTGDELESVAELALRAQVNTNSFGSVAKQLGLDASGAAGLLEDLTKASQDSGVGVDRMTQTIQRNAARWLEAGGSMEDLTDFTVAAAYQFGEDGLRGAVSKAVEHIDQGMIPTFSTMNELVGDSEGTIMAASEAGVGLTDRLKQMKERAVAMVGPYGDAAGSVAGIATAVATVSSSKPLMAGIGKAARLMWTAIKGPIGIIISLIVTGLIVAWAKWGDQIAHFLKGVWNKFVGALESGMKFLKRFIPFLGSKLPDSLDMLKFSMDDAKESTENMGSVADELTQTLADTDEAASGVSHTLVGFSVAASTASAATEELSGSVAELIEDIGNQERWAGLSAQIPDTMVTTIQNSERWGELSKEMPNLVLPELVVNETLPQRLAKAFGSQRTKDLISAQALKLSHDFSAALANGESFGAAFTDLFSSENFRNTMVNLGGDLGESVGGAFAGPLGAAVGRALGAAAGSFLSKVRDAVGDLFGTSAADIAKQRGWDSFVMTPDGPAQYDPSIHHRRNTWRPGSDWEGFGERPSIGGPRKPDNPAGALANTQKVTINVDGRELAAAVIEHTPGAADEFGLGG